jgi:hypothetical protein
VPNREAVAEARKLEEAAAKTDAESLATEQEAVEAAAPAAEE